MVNADSPDDGGPSVKILNAFCKAEWQPDSRFFYLSVLTGFQSAGAYWEDVCSSSAAWQNASRYSGWWIPLGSCYRCTSRCPRD